MVAFSLLLEPELLANQLPLNRNTLIIEQASQTNYLAGHIPGSVWLDFKMLQASTSPAGKLPTAEQLSALFSQLGITTDTHIICSDDEGGGWAGRLIWILDCIGHRHYSLLNGGLTAWKHAGLPLSQEPAAVAPSQYQAHIMSDSCSVGKEHILTHLNAPDFAIWDARSQAEYCGEKANSARAGHIPGARHYEWTQTMDTHNGLRLRDLTILRTELAQLGLNERQEIVTHCQSHHRSGLTYVIGKLLGFNIKGYAGSWAEWGNDPSTPIHLGTQP